MVNWLDFSELECALKAADSPSGGYDFVLEGVPSKAYVLRKLKQIGFRGEGDTMRCPMRYHVVHALSAIPGVVRCTVSLNSIYTDSRPPQPAREEGAPVAPEQPASSHPMGEGSGATLDPTDLPPLPQWIEVQDRGNVRVLIHTETEIEIYSGGNPEISFWRDNKVLLADGVYIDGKVVEDVQDTYLERGAIPLNFVDRERYTINDDLLRISLDSDPRLNWLPEAPEWVYLAKAYPVAPDHRGYVVMHTLGDEGIGAGKHPVQAIGNFWGTNSVHINGQKYVNGRLADKKQEAAHERRIEEGNDPAIEFEAEQPELSEGSVEPKNSASSGAASPEGVPEDEGSRDAGAAHSEPGLEAPAEGRGDSARDFEGQPARDSQLSVEQGEDDNSDVRGGISGVSGNSSSGGKKLAVEPDAEETTIFRIGDLLETVGGFKPATKYKQNVEAIKLLQELNKSGRLATEDEKRAMARFCGWGGLGRCLQSFGEANPWEERAREELLDLLGEDERRLAREASLTSYYTPPSLIRSIWRGVGQLGFNGGRVLEPGCGVGNFLGLCPDELVSKCSFTGVDQDRITGGLAAHIYPEADIRVESFEESTLPNNFYDLVIGNVPFGSVSMYDPTLKCTLDIHDYFIARSLDLLRPGGIMAVVTSTSTMQNKNPEMRREFAKRGAVLAGAVRLPGGVFSSSAGTDVDSDVLFFVKSADKSLLTSEKLHKWIELVPNEAALTVEKETGWGSKLYSPNTYFAHNPQQVLGEYVLGGKHSSVTIKAGHGQTSERSLLKGVEEALKSSANHQVIKSLRPSSPSQEIVQESSVVELDEKLPIGHLFVHEDDKVYRVIEEGEAEETGYRGIRLKRLKHFCVMRDAQQHLIDMEKKNSIDTDEVLLARKQLNEAYEAFIGAKLGPVNTKANRPLFREDPDAGSVFGLEIFDEEKGTAEKASIFFERVVRPQRQIEQVDTPEEALAICLNDVGRINMQRIAALCDMSIDDVTQALLGKQLFIDPENDNYITREKYLGGNVRLKLQTAENAAQIDSQFLTNVEALREIQPQDLSVEDISVRLGAAWINPNIYVDFICDLLEADTYDRKRVRIRYNDLLGRWEISLPSHPFKTSVLAQDDYGSSRMPFSKIFEKLLNQQKIEVRDRDKDDKTYPNSSETLVAQDKADIIKKKFVDWLWDDPERTRDLVEEYNEKFNSYVSPKYDGSHLQFPGMTAAIKPRRHQRDSVWRAVHGGNVYLAHEVGTGKTIGQVAIAIEAKRMGLCNKPFWVVPNHVLEQSEREARQLYPTARILAVQKADLDKDRRRIFAGKVQNNNYDLVIMTHEQFKAIKPPLEFEMKFLKDEITNYEVEMLIQKESGNNRLTERMIQVRLKSLKAKLLKLSDTDRDKGVFLDDLGVDYLLVDEAHNFKNLAVPYTASNLGNEISGSQRAHDLYVKTRWLFEEKGEISGLVMASGTPISNNVLEFFNVQRYIQPEVLSELGLNTILPWEALFLEPKVFLEPDASGQGLKPRMRYMLQNLPELVRMLSANMDVVTCDDAGIKRPDMVRIKQEAELSFYQHKIRDWLVGRMQRIGSMHVDPTEDNVLKIVTDGRKLAVYPPMMHEDIPEEGNTKIGLCADNVVKEWWEGTSKRTTQLVFLDMGTPKPHNENAYGFLKELLIDRGVPEEEIAYIHDAKNDKAKDRLFEKVREGVVRILIGSTAKMGEGTNVQKRLIAVHHLDAPWRPSDIEQRDGRIWRQGNENEEIRSYIYATRGSFDLFVWKTLEYKANCFSRALKGDPSIRTLSMEVDPTFAEVVAITSDNELLRRRVELEQDIKRLESLERQHSQNKYQYQIRLREIEDRKQSLNEAISILQKLPAEMGDTTVWSVAIPAMGNKEAQLLEGYRETIAPRVVRIMSKLELTTYDGVQCGDVPVSVSRAWDPQRERFETLWSLECGITKNSSADIHGILLSGRERIVNYEEALVRMGQERARMEEYIEKGFDKADDLTWLLKERQEVEEELSKNGQEQSSFIELGEMSIDDVVMWAKDEYEADQVLKDVFPDDMNEDIEVA